MPVDAERWLASRGVRREPLFVPGPDETPAPSGPIGSPVADPAPELIGPPRGAADGLQLPADDGPDGVEADPSSANSVGAALAFIRRSTANAPQSEGRLRTKLADRAFSDPVVDEALREARRERLVDDEALLAALIAERRARGHADVRLRRDLRDRGFTGTQVDEALTRHAATDPSAAAFALAREQAARHRAVDAEAAVRRTVGFLVRRGHSEGLARKAARDAVYADRETQEIAGR
jgi:SOS response regulatory protein OraA/RecX